MKEKFNEKVIPIIIKFINTKGIQSIKNGMVTSYEDGIVVCSSVSWRDKLH